MGNHGNTGTLDLLTTTEARRILAMSQSSVSRAVASGKLTPAVRAGAGLRAAMLFARSDVEQLAAERAAS